MDDELWALLRADASIFSILDDRIFWGIAPEGTARPMLVLTIISGAEGQHLRGTDGLWRYRVQMDSYGANRPAATDLSRAVVSLLNGYRGGKFRSIFLDGTREDIEEAAHGRPYRISTDFIIFWRA